MRQGPFPRRIPSLFWKCIALSLSVHLVFVFIIYKQPLWVAKWLSPFAHLLPQKSIVYEPNEELFEGVFDQLIVVSPQKTLGFDTPSNATLEHHLPTLENPVHRKEILDLPFNPSFSFIVEHSEGLILREPSFSFPVAFSFPEIEPTSIAVEKTFMADLALPSLSISTVQVEGKVMDAKKVYEEPTESFSASSFSSSVPSAEPLPSLYSSKLPHADDVDSLDVQFKQRQAPPASSNAIAKAPLRLVQTYALPHWEKRENWNALFDVDVCVMHRKEQEGLYFAVTLNPKTEALEKKIKQRFHFIIDASKYTERHRLTIYKTAVERALNYLQAGQSFNIHIVDHDTRSLSNTCLEVSKKTLAQARSFLEKPSVKETSEKGSLLSLLKEIGSKSSEVESIGTFDTVLFITDGAFLKHKTTGIQAFKKWLRTGPPAFLFNIATVGSDPHDPLLDAIASSSGGTVLHSMTHSAFARKFAKLLIDLKAPIMTNVVPQLTSNDKNLAISLMGTCCKATPIFASRPTTFYGVATAPSSFSLSIDGWNHADPVEVALNIDLKECRQGTIFMGQIALQDKAEHELSLYLENGIEAHFDQAMEWIEEATQPLKR